MNYRFAANWWRCILCDAFPDMKLRSLIAAAGVSVISGTVVHAGDATTPVDYAQRNAAFAPGATVAPDRQTPQVDEAVQDKRFEKNVVDKQPAAVGDRRAPVDVQETREKNVLGKNSHRPDAIEQPKSALDHREATMATATNTLKPPLVTKYQDSLTAASTSNLARFSAMGGATTAKINRFVFRKNASDPITGNAPVTTAGGAAPVPK